MRQWLYCNDVSGVGAWQWAGDRYDSNGAEFMRSYPSSGHALKFHVACRACRACGLSKPSAFSFVIL